MVSAVIDKEELVKNIMRQAEENLPSLLEGSGLSLEQQDLVKAGASAKRLIVRDPYKKALGAMIAARQLYAVAMREIINLVEQEGHTAHPLTADAMVQAAMNSAAQPFSEHTLVTSLVESVMPWVAEVVDKHTSVDEKAAKEERAEVEKERRARPVPIGFRHEPELGEPALGRDRGLVLAGWRNAVLYLLDQITNAALVVRDKQVYTVARLTNRRITKADVHRYLVYVAKESWAGSADSKGGMVRLYDSKIYPMLSEPLDLLVCDDLTEAVTRKFSWRPLAAEAGDANHMFGKLCKVVGSALVGGVPLSGMDPPDIRLPEWEQLRTFATVRQVRVWAEADNLDPDKYRIAISNVAHYWEVTKSALDAYDPGSGIIVPEAPRLIT